MVLCFEGYYQESEKITTKWEEISSNYISRIEYPGNIKNLYNSITTVTQRQPNL